MDLVNCEIANGGDRGNTVVRFGVTAAELAVLIALHGEDAVFNIEPAGKIDRRNREERERLRFAYGATRVRGDDEIDAKSVVELLYPGAAARVHEELDELEIPEHLFKPTARAGGVRAFEDALG